MPFDFEGIRFISLVTVILMKITDIRDFVQNLSNYQFFLIYSGVILFFAGYLFCFDFLVAKNNFKELEIEAKILNARLKTVQQEAKLLPQKRIYLKKKSKEFNQYAKIILDEKHISSLLTDVSVSGTQAGIEFLIFELQPEIESTFFTKIPITITAKGNFHQIGVFLDKISKLSQIVILENIKVVSEDKKGTLIISCTASGYTSD